MSSAYVDAVQLFYLRSYDKTIGTATSIAELKKEIMRFAGDNPTDLECRRKQGNIVHRLNYSNQKHKVARPMDVESIEELQSKVTTDIKDKQNFHDESKPCRLGHPKKGL